MQSDLYKYDTIYVNGAWVQPRSTEKIPVRSPATEEIVGYVPSCSPGDIDLAVQSARVAFDNSGWPDLSIGERAKYLRSAARILKRRQEDSSLIAADESGLPIGFRYGDGSTFTDQAIKLLNYYADLGEKYQVEEQRTGADGGKIIVRKEPVGVVGVITPWNAPLVIAHFSIPPALLAGCTVVLKPAPESPLHANLIAQVFQEAGLPPGVFNVVPAEREASEALVRHPGVDKIVFTGSTATGRRIGALCGESIKRFGLELGGKSAAVILDDADLDQVMPFVTFTGLMNNGEACVGQTRILAPRSRYSEVVERLAAIAGEYRTGDPRDIATQNGPLITEKQRAKGESYIHSGLEEGAKLVLGGKRPEHLGRGWYLEPTIFSDVSMGMRIAKEEIFCPVLCVIPYADDADAISIANDSPYGLSGTVWTSDEARGMKIARKIRTGNYGINYFNLDINAPFGGFKESGIGRQLGPEGLEGFFELKAIHFPPQS